MCGAHGVCGYDSSIKTTRCFCTSQYSGTDCTTFQYKSLLSVNTLVIVLTIIITLVTLCSQFLWLSMTREMLEQAAPADAPLMMVIRFALDNPLLYVLVSLASFAFQIYFVSVLLFLGFRITGVKHASFHILFQVVAYSSAPLLLCIIPVLGPQVGLIWSLACLVNGCRMALRIDWPRTLLGLAPLVLLFVVLLSSLRLP